tara:strand:+ start:393 stop:686 length:294 start_codon:yes stop_codon:yes gene_type:complete
MSNSYSILLNYSEQYKKYNEKAVAKYWKGLKIMDELEHIISTKKDNITASACIELFLRNIDCNQVDDDTIVLNSERDRTYAMILLSDSKDYTVEYLD